MVKKLVLDAACLAHKWGFYDGDVVSEFLADNNVFIDCTGNSNQMTTDVVKKYLLPLIPNVEVYEVCTHHNPIRCKDEWIEYCEKCDICVEVSLNEIVSTIMGR